MEPHIHTEECYVRYPEVQFPSLICSYETLGVHIHGADCLDEQGRVLCGQADYLIHTHHADCYDEAGELRCSLAERSKHVHDDACFRLEGGHTHGEDCYLFLQGALLCALADELGTVWQQQQLERLDYYIEALRREYDTYSKALTEKLKLRDVLCLCASLGILLLVW
jgi:hypothetical protein